MFCLRLCRRPWTFRYLSHLRRRTNEQNEAMLKLLGLFRVKLTRKDLYMDAALGKELEERAPGVGVPAVFASGNLLGVREYTLSHMRLC